MADTKLTGLTALSEPALADLAYVVHDPSGSPLGQKVTIQALRNGYVIEACAAAFDPADGTSYYLGAAYAAQPSTTAALRVLRIPRAGTVAFIALSVFVNGVLGSNTTSTISFLLNNTTLTTISSSVVANATVYSVTPGLNIAVAFNDYFEIKWVTPTWATNPTSVTVHASVYIT